MPMQKRLSRRELMRRTEQGRTAMRVLAAVIVQSGGTVRLTRNVFEGLPVGHRMEVERDPLTGDLILTAAMPPEQETGKVLTFEEVRSRYAGQETHDAGHDEGLPSREPLEVPGRER